MTRVRICLLVTALLLLLNDGARAEGFDLAVVTHPSRPVSLTSSDVRRIFLKQRRFWQDGSPVIAINHESTTPIRQRFEAAVFGQDGSILPAYWNRRYFEGLFPPITLGSDEAVRKYVAAKPNAIGYVDVRSIDETVQVALRIRLPDKPRP